MNVKISSGAKRYLEKQGYRVLVLSYMEMEVKGTVGVVKDVQITHEPPRQTGDYFYAVVDGFEVYIDNRLKIDKEVIIKKQGFWKFSSLYADGLRIPF